MFDRYSVSNLRYALEHPSLVIGEINRISTEFNKKFSGFRYQDEGIAVSEQDWDNLFILDACRFDIFTEEYTGSEEVERVTTKGTMSEEFLQRNFADKNCHDIVYVSANPYIESIPDGTFHHVDPLYRNAWDEDLETVAPETVAKAAREAANQYPNKRIVAHFMQPHTPFIGEIGRTISESEKNNTTDRMGRDNPLDTRDVWSNLRYNLTDDSIEDVRQAYVENLRLVLDPVQQLCENLVGKAVITADHGELLGDRLRPIPVKGFGHPRGIGHPALVSVPWVSYESESRREIISEEPDSERDVSNQVVENRLQKLGYKN